MHCLAIENLLARVLWGLERGPNRGAKSRATEGRWLLFWHESSHGPFKDLQPPWHLLLLRGCHWCGLGPDQAFQRRRRDAVHQSQLTPLRQKHHAQRYWMSQQLRVILQADERQRRRQRRSEGLLVELHSGSRWRKGGGRGARMEVLNHVTRLHEVLHLRKGDGGGPVLVKPRDIPSGPEDQRRGLRVGRGGNRTRARCYAP